MTANGKSFPDFPDHQEKPNHGDRTVADFPHNAAGMFDIWYTLLALVGQKHLTDFSRLMWNLHCPYCITHVLTPLHLQEMNPFTVFFNIYRIYW